MRNRSWRQAVTAMRAGWTASAFLLAMVFAPAHAQLVDISDTPLFGGRAPHPNVSVALSVEFPTVGAAYNNVAYVPTSTYLGYFDPAKCYTYATGNGGYFRTSVNANANANHECSNAFSGNFMNWATMSAIDEFRYAMTGGNRTDETGPNNGTIIDRAYLPDGSVPGVPDFYAYSSNFPRHTLSGGNIDGYASSAASAVLPSSIASSGTIYVTNCKTQVYFGSGGGGSCGSPDANLGTYNVRVNVCDSDEGPVRTDLCLDYGNGNSGPYKPVGEGQRNASKMRFTVFGYLMDRSVNGYSAPCNDGAGWNRCRYGGVLRAPMKYLGGTKYDANLQPSNNPKREIRNNGRLVDDPEGTAASAGGQYSGFLNYINKFGSTGVYKRLDPMGEQYYEAIRYYQNLGPTPEAIQNVPNNDVKDFFPFESTWSDPILSRCSSNYIISLSDANTWDDTYLPGYNGSPGTGYGRPGSRPATGGLDAYLWTQRIGALESSTTSLVTNDVRPGLSNIANQNTANQASYLAAGAAFWANTNDIRTDLVGTQTIKTISFDVAEPSIDVHDRQLYLMGKYGGFANSGDRTSDTYPNPFWTADPTSNTGAVIRSNAEWEDSPGSGYPANYLLASDPQKLINGLRAAFARISAQTGNISGAALTSSNLSFGAAGAYNATFDPARWSGAVKSYTLSVSSTGQLVVSPSATWNSSTVLDARCGTIASGTTTCKDNDTSASKRNVVTTIKQGGTRTAVNFTYANVALDTQYLATLNRNPSTSAVDNLAQARVNYLRGFRGDETATSPNNFRIRDSAMGDVINSGPVYVGPPSSTVTDADYQPFYASNSGRTAAVYVGANDGMLHALRASDGVELFSYIPGYAYADLADLTDPGYTHETFVDTVPKIQEAKVNGTWKTVLVGASGSGAQGIFALDVTDPTAFGPSKVLFEFSDADDADFGSVLAQPEIAKLRVGGTAAAPVYKYFAVVTGYNNTRTDVNGKGNADTSRSANTVNDAFLFLVSLDHTLGTAWTLGTDYYKFRFPASNTARANGLGPVTLLPSRSGDGTTSAMYFGDLQGNLWRFNTNGVASAWTPARGTVAAPLPIFVAKDASGNRQPITARPEIASGPFGSVLVFFGTGQYLGQTDVSLPGTQQSEYALLDTASSSIIDRSNDLVQRAATVSGGNITITGAPFTYSGASGKRGWYLDFPSSPTLGERSITKPAIRTGLLTFTTLTLSTDICGGGSGYVYQVNALTGLTFGSAAYAGYSSTVGIPGPPRIVDLTMVTNVQQPGRTRINTKTQTTVVAGTTGDIKNVGPALENKTAPTDRIDWREITNWNDMTGR